MIDNVSVTAALFAGLLSFVSPCVLPMLPTFSLILAQSIDGQEERKWNIYINSICFLSGFTLVFIIMGATASLMGQWFFNYQEEIKKAGAIIIIIMGIILTGHFQTTFLGRDYRPFLKKTFKGPVGAFLLGTAFTAGWTPCTGPILAAILIYAGQTGTVKTGIFLLFVYSMGFSIPFFLFVAVLKKYLIHMRKFYGWLPIIQKVAGYMMIILGAFIWLDWLQKGIGIIFSIF
ncbi:cytochrome c biogenesis CcdA family protein [Pectinatus sottacetonis]|uniref:cytochrome c biogenesis CcdA family protein n=1 Tax=Pectinatus sottacetonis TaxID=1002795 RepID=UPI0018C48491|nr:cytochrome c biogenesis CcdA family protein [Pectinatus sottacetonis]